MNDPDGLLVEAKRAVNELGAVGVQVMSNILGRPVDKPDTMPLFDLWPNWSGASGSIRSVGPTSQIIRPNPRAITKILVVLRLGLRDECCDGAPRLFRTL